MNEESRRFSPAARSWTARVRPSQDRDASGAQLLHLLGRQAEAVAQRPRPIRAGIW